LQIRNYGDTLYEGVGVFNTTGESQTNAQGSPFFPVIFQVKVVNTGGQPDSFIITGSRASTSNYRVWYFDSQVQGSPQTGPPGGQDISAQVVGKRGWNTGVLQPGAFREFRFEAGASPFAPAGAQQTITLTARSASDKNKVDVVKGTATNDVRRSVDIRRRNTSGAGPYLVDLENTGNIADQYRVTATPSGAGYTVRYFDAYSGGNDITAAITGGGWTTNSLGFHGLQNLAIQITPTDGQAHQITMVVLSVGDAGVASTLTLSTAATAASPSFFPIGVFRQPTFEFDTWKARGINTLVDWDSFGGQTSMDEWTQAAVDRQLYMIRAPRTDATLDVNQPYLLAWMHPDEPELTANYPAATAQQNYNALKQIDPTKPVLANFAGGYLIGWQAGNFDYPGYIHASDWESSGTYPISGFNRPDDLDAPGRTLDQVEKLSNGAPNFAIIESSNQMGPWNPPGVPGPTPAQVQAETWDAIIHGARGIIYFPQSLTPTFRYDNTTPQVAAAITAQDARITSIGAALESPIDPPSVVVSATGSPLEATWRVYNGKTYLVVLNMSGQKLKKQRLALSGIGGAKATVQGERRSVRIANHAIVDSFAPYGVHIYVV
jgi:hypothetical protein